MPSCPCTRPGGRAYLYFMVAASNPTTGNCPAKASTSARSSANSGHGSALSAALKSASFLPTLAEALTCFAISTPRWMKWATASKSSSTKPREVSAGVPTRMPPGMKADLSPGTVFLLRATLAISRTDSTRAPSMPEGFRSTSSRWLSVPPETREYPRSVMAEAKRAQFLITCVWYPTNSGVAACFSAVASAVMVWLWGPPWWPGKTEALIGPSRSYRMGLPFLSIPLTPFR
mmetsp:Transcript_21863/g.70613  ORF Transcript_21863/g.70613 Transcript_21863/m.70613 type:complete len:232 (-) Transcript_21863:166-861(-)